MKYHSFLMHKYLTSRLIAIFAVVAVALGVFVLLATLSVMEGFKIEMRDRIRGTESHLRVRGARYLSLLDEDRMLEAVRSDPDVVAAAPYVDALAIFKTDAMQFCEVFGVDPIEEARVGDFADYLLRDEEWIRLVHPDHSRSLLPPDRKPLTDDEIKEIFSLERRRRIASRNEDLLAGMQTHLPPQPVVVGLQAVRNGTMRPGQIVQLSAHSAVSEEPRSQKFLVVGVFMTGSFQEDLRRVYMPIRASQEFLALWDPEVGEGGDFHFEGIKVKLRDYRQVDGVRERMERGPAAELSRAPLIIETWEEKQAVLLRAVDTEKNIVSILMLAIICFAAIIVFVILYLLVIEKTRDLGVLASLGATPSGIIGMFTSIGLILSVTGAAIGTAGGLLITMNANELLDIVYRATGWQLFPPDIYYLTALPVRYTVRDFSLVLGSTLLFGLLGSLLPAWIASRRDPIKALHHE